MSLNKGRLIAFSGIDGAGKSTQINLIIDKMNSQGVMPVYLWSRGGYTGPFNALKSLARKVLGKKAIPSGRTEQRSQMFRKAWVRNVWLTLAIIDLIFVYGIYIRLLKLRGYFVIADRYLWDTWIDFTLNFPGVRIDQWALWKLLVRVAPVPDFSFVLLVPVEESLRRSKLKDEPFPDSEETLLKRHTLYRELSKKTDFSEIECLESIDAIHQQILSELKFTTHS